MSAPALPYAFAKAHGILVAGQGADHSQLLLREGASLEALAEVRRSLGLPLQIENVSRATFEARLSEAYSGTDGNAAEVVADVGQEVDLTQLMTELPAVEDLLETQDDAPIIRMINALLTQAVRQAASDIHIEPYEKNSVVRFRRDGVLVDVAQPHRALHAAMASRIKIMASLDIAEKRLPQDGRIALRLAGRQVDVRVSTLPTTHGERIVLRLLDKGSGQRGLDTFWSSSAKDEAEELTRAVAALDTAPDADLAAVAAACGVRFDRSQSKNTRKVAIGGWPAGNPMDLGSSAIRPSLIGRGSSMSAPSRPLPSGRWPIRLTPSGSIPWCTNCSSPPAGPILRTWQTWRRNRSARSSPAAPHCGSSSPAAPSTAPRAADA